MSLTFREQIEETAWELGNGEGTVPELRQRFDDNPDTPNFDPAKEMCIRDRCNTVKTKKDVLSYLS